MKKQKVLFIGGPFNGNTSIIPWPWYGTGRVIRPLEEKRNSGSFTSESETDKSDLDELALANEYVTREFHLEGKIYLIAMQQEQSADCISQHIREHHHHPLV